MAVPPFPITGNIISNATALPTVKTAYCSSSVPQMRTVSEVGNELNYWMEQAEQAKNSLSDKQKEKIEDRIKKCGDSIKEYPFYQNWKHDQSLKSKK